MASKNKGRILIDMHDIVGKRFVRLEVLEYDRNWYDKTAGGDRMRHSYLCQCNCGEVVHVRRQCLLNGYTKSCGCLKRKRGK